MSLIRKIKLVSIYVMLFYIVYMPPIFNVLININDYAVVVFLFGLMLIPYFLSIVKHRQIVIEKKNKNLFCGIIISSLYFFIIAIFRGNNPRIVQNNFIVIQIIFIIIILDKFKKLGLKKNQIIKLILLLGVIQGVISLFMMFIPQFKNIAVNLYLAGGAQENLFITSKRIYGISGDYTYFTPIFNSLLASGAYILTIIDDFKYFKYIPLIVIAIALNGRTGLVIFVVSIFIITFLLLIKRFKVLKILMVLFVIMISFGSIILVIKNISPDTYMWILSLLNEIYSFIISGEATGNTEVLVGEMLYFPKGINLIIGSGHRVFGNSATLNGYIHSDIGYVNDMFMGGIIYMLILYSTIFRYIFYDFTMEINTNNLLSIILFFTIIIANYKGEAIRGGAIILGVIMIKMIFINEGKEING